MGSKPRHYDAFISYSREDDRGLGRAVQWGVQRFARPWYRVTARDVFRDDTNLAANPQLWEEIKTAIDRSDYFILLASPAAAHSPWVEREVAHRLARRGCDSLLVGLVDGTIRWDSASRSFDRKETNALPPSLKTASLAESLYADFTWVKSAKEQCLRNTRFATEIARLVSAISGLPLDRLIGEHIRQRRRMKAVAFLATLAIAAATVFGVWQARIASDRAKLAFSSRLASHSHELLRDRPDLAMLLAVKATRIANTVNARASLIAALEAEPAIVRFLRGHTAAVSSVVMDQDRRMAASGDETGQILFWDLDRREQMGPAAKQSGAVTGLAISPNGRTLASGGTGNEIILWDVARRRRIGRSLVGHAQVVNDVAFANDRLLASGSSDGTVALWDVPDQTRLISLDAEVGSILHIVASRKGDLLAVAGTRGIRVLDLGAQRWQSPHIIGPARAVLALDFAPDATKLAVGDTDGSILLQTITPAESRRLKDQTAKPLAVAFGSGGTPVFAGDASGTLRRWNVQTQEELTPEWRSSASALRAIAAARVGGMFLTGNQDGTVVLWDAVRADALSTTVPPEQPGGISSIAFSGGGASLISGGYDGTILLRDDATGQASLLAKAERTAIVSIAANPVGRLFAFKDGKRTVAVGGLAEPAGTIRRLDGYQAVSNVVFADGGRKVAFGAKEGVVFWDLSRNTVSATPSQSDVVNVAAAGDLVATGGRDGAIALLDAQTGRPLAGRPMSQGSNIPSLVFNRDASLLATAGDDGSVAIWRTVDRTLVWRIAAGHGQEIRAVAFSADDTMLAVGGGDGFLTLWDLATGQPVGAPFESHAGGVEALEFSNTGTLLASAGMDGRVRLWTVGLDAWRRQACAIANRELSVAEREVFVEGDKELICKE
jgi:WD40 repeat protein